MDYQMLVLDLDGTLTNSDKEITAPTLTALLQLQERGKKVVLASGRPLQGVLPLAKELHLKDYGGYILAYNGARIVDCSNQHIIYNRALPMDTLAPIVHIAEQYDVGILGYQDDLIISGLHENKYSQIEAFINKTKLTYTDDFLTYISSPTNKLLVTGEPLVVASVETAMKNKFHTFLNIYRSEPFFLEIMPQKIDKAYSLQKLLNSVGLTSEQMICCGDGYNDITMIESAGLGVAMANAQPLVKESADYIT
ncbi:MAG: Cof-type HAD-IIB family hydrolase, partial [Lachnospiraceae bacterium]